MAWGSRGEELPPSPLAGPRKGAGGAEEGLPLRSKPQHLRGRPVLSQVDGEDDGILPGREESAGGVRLEGQLEEGGQVARRNLTPWQSLPFACCRRGASRSALPSPRQGLTLCEAPLCWATRLVVLQHWVAESSAMRTCPSRAHMARVESPLLGRNLACGDRGGGVGWGGAQGGGRGSPTLQPT